MACKLTPNLEQHHRSTKVLNLTVLQRIDPLITEILITATHVAFYHFNAVPNQWSRKDVEGSLFVVKRNGQPRFQFIIMNRRSTENLVEDLLGDLEFEVQIPYLLYRNGAQEVNGIWFYDSRDCEEVGRLFYRITNAYSKVPPKPKLSAAKSEFEELDVVPSLSLIEGPLEPPPAAASIPHVPDESFNNFLNVAMNVERLPNSAISGKPPIASLPIPIPSHVTSASVSALPADQSSPFLPTSATRNMPTLAVHESSNGTNNSATNLVKPSLFSTTPAALVMPPLSASIPTSPPLHPSVTMQRPYGTPLLQPFPPPTPSASLTPQSNTPAITRDSVRGALQRLVQNNDFIEMVYMGMLSAHCS